MNNQAMNSLELKYETLIRDVLYSITGNDQFNKIKPGTNLSKYGFDSIMFISVIVKLEEVLGIEIPNEFMLVSKGDTIKKLNTLIEKMINR